MGKSISAASSLTRRVTAFTGKKEIAQLQIGYGSQKILRQAPVVTNGSKPFGETICNLWVALQKKGITIPVSKLGIHLFA